MPRISSSRIWIWREWQRNAIAFHFERSGFDCFRQRVLVQDVRDGVANAEHQDMQAAMLLIWTRTALVKILTHARDRRERTFQLTNHSPDSDAVHRTLEKVTSILPTLAVEITQLLELDKNLLQELDRQILAPRQLADLQHGPVLLLREAKIYEGA